MKRMIYAAALLLAATGTGCDKNDSGSQNGDSGTPTMPEERQIIFTTAIASTRAPQLEEDGSGTLTAGDTFTLYAYDAANGSAQTDYTIGATALYWRDLTFAAQQDKVHFAACYPKQILTDGEFDFTVTQDDVNGDLLWASAPDVEVGTEKPVALTFRHAMHRLTVNYTILDESIDATQIETYCTAHASCRVQLAEGRLIQHDTKETFMALGQKVKFLLLPQSTSEVTLEIRAGKTTKIWKLSEAGNSCPELEGGKELTVELTVQEGKIVVSGLSVEGWGDQGTIEGDIIL